LPPLIENGIDGNGGLAGLPVSQDQLALSPSDRRECIDDLDAGLQRHADRRAVHDGLRVAFDRQALQVAERTLAVECSAERINDAPEERLAHGDVHDPARSRDLIAGMQVRIIAEEDDADLLRIDVEGNAVEITRKSDQLLEAHAT